MHLPASTGKARALEARFRDASKLLARHGLNVVGYWVPYDDPAFQKYAKAEDAEHLIESVDTVYMRASAYSKSQ